MNSEAEQQCIFCLNHFPQLTDEHVIPDAIGGSMILQCACRDCNSYLGSKVDVHLVSNLLAEFIRFEKGLLGRRKNLKHPLTYGKLVERPDVGVRPNFGEEGPRRIILDTSVKYRVEEDGTQRVEILLDQSNESELPAILEKIENRMRAKGFKIDSSTVKPEFRSVENPQVSFHHEFDLLGLDKAVLKIIYEVAWSDLGPEYIYSENGQRLRDFIMDPDSTQDDLASLRLRGQIEFRNSFKDMFDFIKCDHLIVILGQPAKAVYVRIFDFYGALILVDDDADLGLMEVEGSKFIEFDVKNSSHSVLNMSQVLSKYLPES